MASPNFYNLKVNPDAKSSRFIIDLKENLPEQDIKQAQLKKSRNIEEKLEKLAEIDYGKYFKAGKNKVGQIFKPFSLNKILFNLKSLWIPSPLSRGLKAAGMTKGKAGMTKENKALNDSLLSQLAFFSLGRLLFTIFKKLFILFYKICYAVGWVIMFILRLAYFLLSAIARPVIKVIKFLFFKFQIYIYETLNFLPTELRATQAVVVSMFARLPRPPQMRGPRNDKQAVGYLKPVLVFAGVLLMIILPIKAFTYYKVINLVKGKVLGVSELALNNLIFAGQAAKDFNFSQAGQGFQNAGDNFLSAQNELEKINGWLLALAAIAPDKDLRLAAAGQAILRAGELGANAGKNLSLAMDSLFSRQTNGVDNILANLSLYGHNAAADLTELTKVLNQIDSQVLPEDYQERFILLKQKTNQLALGLNEFIGLADSLRNFLGASTAKRYLLVFQNNSELRASGGFIGSFALIDFSKGEIKNIEVPGGGSYDTEAGWLKKIKPPEPLSLVRADWHFWDANWWPDWPMSARKLAWFYENSDGPTVDGVISFTPTVMEKLLTIIGPIDLKEKYGLTIDAANFWLETQKLAEQKPDVTKQPKKIIGDLMNEIIKQLPQRLNKNNLAPLFKIAEESLTGKNILFYFTDTALEAKADDLGWSGRVKDAAGDYLNVVNTNIAGGKSDRKIKQQIIHQAKVQPDGSIIDDLTIRRVHQAIKREPFSGVRNVDWLRIYVPLGSELLEANGFKPVAKIFFAPEMAGLADDPDVLAGEGQARTDQASGVKIYNELNKTVFANWSQLDPGETIEISLKYRLPFKLTAKKQPADQEFKDQLIAKAGAVLNPGEKNLYSYSLLAQKQPGMNSSTIESELELSDNFRPIWKYPAGVDGGQNGWSISQDLNQDKIMAIIVEER
ncbi:MAG: DUF4012 domain-containing protein [Parcubacteria group bacterium]|nr:DUF4012 domain-containing protein [Parcubacteria group bacterium]